MASLEGLAKAADIQKEIEGIQKYILQHPHQFTCEERWKFANQLSSMLVNVKTLREQGQVLRREMIQSQQVNNTGPISFLQNSSTKMDCDSQGSRGWKRSSNSMSDSPGDSSHGLKMPDVDMNHASSMSSSSDSILLPTSQSGSSMSSPEARPRCGLMRKIPRPCRRDNISSASTTSSSTDSEFCTCMECKSLYRRTAQMSKPKPSFCNPSLNQRNEYGRQGHARFLPLRFDPNRAQTDSGDNIDVDDHYLENRMTPDTSDDDNVEIPEVPSQSSQKSSDNVGTESMASSAYHTPGGMSDISSVSSGYNTNYTPIYWSTTSRMEDDQNLTTSSANGYYTDD